MKLTCVIADDEYLALRILTQYIATVPSLELLAQFKNPLEAFAFLEKNPADLIFLDIQMPGLNGIEFVKKLPHKPLVIFTTARHEYAVEAYELDVLDYLVKPLAPERFEKAIQKVLQYAQYKQGFKEEKTAPRYLLIKADYRVVQISFDDIIFIEGLNEYVKIYTPDKKHITLAAIKDIEQQLPAQEFIRIHKSYLLAKKSIASYNAASVTLRNQTTLPVGRKYKEDFLRVMQS
jgi:DNA-binding LytR/AlgR family response regulator